MQVYEKETLEMLNKQSIRRSLGMPVIPSDVSPFRYPGGKGKLSKFLALFIITNQLQGCKLVEPFCGGAGGTLPLLLTGLVDKLVLNDANPAVSAFWETLKLNPDALINRVEKEEISINRWHHWREVYFERNNVSQEEKGFSALFLNRTNRSGMFHAGPIGGRAQLGDYLLNCRFTRSTLINRIKKIVAVSDKLIVTNKDAIDAISRLSANDFIYADPPYVKEGKNIYNAFCFSEVQHQRFASSLKRKKAHWLLSYDDHPLVHRFYSKSGINIIELGYAINKARVGQELLIASANLRQPIIANGSSFDKTTMDNNDVLLHRAEGKT